MQATIYYFTGTGNSFKIARDVAEKLGETELVSLARATGTQLSPATEVVGIVFPVYAWGPPAAVRRFVEQVKVEPGAYVFAVCTCGGSASGTLVIAEKLLTARGIKLSAGFVVKMPSNYLVWGGALPEEKQQEMFAAAAVRVDEIGAVVGGRQVKEVEKGGPVGRALTGLAHKMAGGSFPKEDKKFTVGESCNGCEICANVCPVGNIEMAGGRPSWLHHCEQCLACIQWCPREAIEVGAKTAGRKRYHHPDVKAADLMVRGGTG